MLLSIQISPSRGASFSAIERITLGKELSSDEDYSVTIYKPDGEEINIEVECNFRSNLTLSLARDVFQKCVRYAKLAVERREG